MLLVGRKNLILSIYPFPPHFSTAFHKNWETKPPPLQCRASQWHGRRTNPPSKVALGFNQELSQQCLRACYIPQPYAPRGQKKSSVSELTEAHECAPPAKRQTLLPHDRSSLTSTSGSAKLFSISLSQLCDVQPDRLFVVRQVIQFGCEQIRLPVKYAAAFKHIGDFGVKHCF